MLLGTAPDGEARPGFRWLVRLIAFSAAVLLPWAAYLAVSLPASVSARHWPMAWTGLDVVMAVGLAATAWLAVRRDWRMAFPRRVNRDSPACRCVVRRLHRASRRPPADGTW
jgi:hypothetical protein